MIGEKGDPTEVSKVIIVKMYDNYYEPSKFEIKKNQTIKFIVYNYGKFVHEFNIATRQMHLKHQSEMMKMVENEILLVDRIDKEKMKKLSNTEAELEAACNVPGHFEAGMIAKINKI